MVLRNFFLVIVVFASYTGWSQLGSEVSTILRSEIPAEKKLQKTDSILEHLLHHKIYDSLDIVYKPYIRWLYYHRNHAKNISVIKKALETDPNERTQDFKWHYLGRTYYALKKFDKSIESHEHIISKNNEDDITGRSYFELGRCYQQKGNFYKAIDYFLLAESVLKKVNSVHVLLASYINIATPYLQLESASSYKKALMFYLKADSLANEINTNDHYKYLVKLNIGDYYNKNKTLDIPKSNNYYYEALAIAEKNNDSAKISNTYNRIGNLYNTTDPKTGISYQQKSLKYAPKTDSLLLASIYLNTAHCLSIQHYFDQSIKDLQKAIQLLKGTKIFEKSSNKDFLLSVLSRMGKIYLKEYYVTSKKQSLQNAIKSFQLADQLIDLIRIESRAFRSKLFWRTQSAELYGKAIEACYLAQDPEQAFFFMEKNKALLLTQDLKRQQLQQALSLPDSIIHQEIELKKELYTLQHSPFKDTDSIATITLATERTLQKLQDQIAKQYTSYTSLQTESPILSLQTVQNSLAQDEAVLMYNIGKYDDYSKITPENGYTPVIPNCAYGVKTKHPAYGLLLTQQDVVFFPLKNAENLQKEVLELLVLVKQPFAKDADRSNYTRAASALYENLLPSKELQAAIQGKRLRIIPDNYLHFLPFEALKINSDSDSQYWVQENEIYYAYSNSFLENIQKHPLKKSLSFAGFAPVHFADSTLVPLSQSPEELKNSSSYFEAENYLEAKATKNQFLEIMPNLDIIHLATHADAQDSIAPWIAFRDEKLLQDELSLTKNQAKLVVLSGCNTLLGSQEIGEGVMSLARGFFHSGAQSVVSSLWNADDRSTSSLMHTFYENLDAGQSKATALHNAKLRYLQNNNFSEASPYYWASFVLVGDASPIVPPFSFQWYWLICLLPFIGFFIYRKFSS